MAFQDVIDALYEKVIADLTGLIAIWSGSIVDIPEGWYLCDGTNGTRDLRDQFIVGAGGMFNPHATGGSDAHGHTVSIPAHSHVLEPGGVIQAGTGRTNVSSAIPLAGSTDEKSNLPPYYALAFIQKI